MAIFLIDCENVNAAGLPDVDGDGQRQEKRETQGTAGLPGADEDSQRQETRKSRGTAGLPWG